MAKGCLRSLGALRSYWYGLKANLPSLWWTLSMPRCLRANDKWTVFLGLKQGQNLIWANIEVWEGEAGIRLNLQSFSWIIFLLSLITSCIWCLVSASSPPSSLSTTAIPRPWPHRTGRLDLWASLVPCRDWRNSSLLSQGSWAKKTHTYKRDSNAFIKIIDLILDANTWKKGKMPTLKVTCGQKFFFF